MGTQSSSGMPFSRASHAGNGELAHRLEDQVGELRERVGVLADRASEAIKQNPLAALVGAAALGFFVARLISRR